MTPIQMKALPAGLMVMASLEPLPAIDAPKPMEGMNWQMRDDALARSKPGLRAAQARRATNVIDIFETIGFDWWTGGGVTAKGISQQLDGMRGDVEVYINSPGGSYFEGVSIYNLLREYEGKVTVKVIGLAASAASIIAMAADELLIAETGSLMIHNVWVCACGDRNDMAKAADTLSQFDEAMAKLYAKRAGIDAAQATEWMDAETWFTGEQAIEAGMADGLIEDDEIEQGKDGEQASLRAEARTVNALKLQNPGLSRKECRALLSDMKGKSSAASEPKAPEGDLAAAVRDLMKTLKG